MRLFLALWPDAAERQRLAAAQTAWPWPPQTAPVPPERLHLTLHYLGEIGDEGAVDEFLKAMSR